MEIHGWHNYDKIIGIYDVINGKCMTAEKCDTRGKQARFWNTIALLIYSLSPFGCCCLRGKGLCFCFIDFKKVFEMVPHEQHFEAHGELMVPSKHMLAILGSFIQLYMVGVKAIKSLILFNTSICMSTLLLPT